MSTDELELRDDDAERALIGAVAFHPDACASVLADLPAEAFHNPHRQRVWAVCRTLSAAGDPITPGHVHRVLVDRGEWNVATQRVVTVEFADSHPASHAARHAELVETLAARRDLVRRATYIQQLLREDHYEPSEILTRMRAVLDAEPLQRAKNTGPMGWRDLVAEFETEHSPDRVHASVPTPWASMDRLLGGLYPGRVYVLGGRPGQGKSTVALLFAVHAAQTGHPTLVSSREMSSVDVTGRILARGAYVDLKDVNARRLTSTGREKIRAYVDEVGDLPLAVDAAPRNLAAIKTLARAHQHRAGLDVLVVDYLQLVHTDSPSRSREQEVAQVSMQLKRLALELGCAVVLPAQLNRGAVDRSDQRPTMANLRDSGQIEQDADVVILLHRPKTDNGDYTGRIQFIVDKNRHGPTAELEMDWFGSYGDIA